jgi:hypothetical protein
VSGPSRLSAAAPVWAGSGALAFTLSEVPAGATAAVIHDVAVEPVVDAIAGAHPRHRLQRFAVQGTARLAAARAAAVWLQSLEPAVVVAVGGGTAVDVAKLATLGAPVRALRLVAVPTTIGTGTEASAVACVVDADGNRTLVHAPALQPDLATLDPLSTRDLPARLVREGALEALVRVAGPEVVTPSSLPIARVEALALVRALAAALRACEDEPSDASRLLLATLSGATHRGWALAGRGPYPWPLWFIANELATVLETTKMEATMLLLGPWMQRVARGDTRWGHYDRLEAVWAEITGNPLPADCAGAYRAWLAKHGLSPRPVDVDDDAARRTAERAVRRWGGPLPMLGRFSRDELETLIAESLAPTAGDLRVAV